MSVLRQAPAPAGSFLAVLRGTGVDGLPVGKAPEPNSGPSRHAAAYVDALFIDPLREGWFAGWAHRYIGSDGIHPTNAGHRHIAALVAADLRDARIAAHP